MILEFRREFRVGSIIESGKNIGFRLNYERNWDCLGRVCEGERKAFRVKIDRCVMEVELIGSFK